MSATYKSIGYWAALLLITLLWTFRLYASQAQESNLQELNRTSYGSTFYMDKDTIQTQGDGKLQYNVIEYQAGQNQPGRVSSSELDCNTGQLKSSTESWDETREGAKSNRLPGPSRPVKIPSYSKSHDIFKEICGQYAPEAKGSW